MVDLSVDEQTGSGGGGTDSTHSVGWADGRTAGWTVGRTAFACVTDEQTVGTDSWSVGPTDGQQAGGRRVGLDGPPGGRKSGRSVGRTDGPTGWRTTDHKFQIWSKTDPYVLALTDCNIIYRLCDEYVMHHLVGSDVLPPARRTPMLQSHSQFPVLRQMQLRPSWSLWDSLRSVDSDHGLSKCADWDPWHDADLCAHVTRPPTSQCTEQSCHLCIRTSCNTGLEWRFHDELKQTMFCFRNKRTMEATSPQCCSWPEQRFQNSFVDPWHLSPVSVGHHQHRTWWSTSCSWNVQRASLDFVTKRVPDQVPQESLDVGLIEIGGWSDVLGEVTLRSWCLGDPARATCQASACVCAVHIHPTPRLLLLLEREIIRTPQLFHGVTRNFEDVTFRCLPQRPDKELLWFLCHHAPVQLIVRALVAVASSLPLDPQPACRPHGHWCRTRWPRQWTNMGPAHPRTLRDRRLSCRHRLWLWLRSKPHHCEILRRLALSTWPSTLRVSSSSAPNVSTCVPAGTLAAYTSFKDLHTFHEV